MYVSFVCINIISFNRSALEQGRGPLSPASRRGRDERLLVSIIIIIISSSSSSSSSSSIIIIIIIIIVCIIICIIMMCIMIIIKVPYIPYMWWTLVVHNLTVLSSNTRCMPSTNPATAASCPKADAERGRV